MIDHSATSANITDSNPPTESRSSALVARNGVFAIDPEACYDCVPDIKAYLCLLGTDDNKIAWFHRDDDGDPTKPLSAGEERLRDACNQAVRRGAERLVKRQKEGRGFFALPSNTADPTWEQIPWVPASGVLQMDEPTRHKYLVAAEENFLPGDEAVDEDMQMPHHGDMLRGNVRVKFDPKRRPDLADIKPSSLEFLLIIQGLYGTITHPMCHVVLNLDYEGAEGEWDFEEILNWGHAWVGSREVLNRFAAMNEGDGIDYFK